PTRSWLKLAELAAPGAKNPGVARRVSVCSTRPKAAPPVAYHSVPLGAIQPIRPRAVPNQVSFCSSVRDSSAPGTVAGNDRQAATQAGSLWPDPCAAAATPSSQDGLTCQFQPICPPRTPPNGARLTLSAACTGNPPATTGLSTIVSVVRFCPT